jgi:hypothetical protein
MSTIACPRHGVLNVAADAPCPHCGVPTYDLDSRDARDVVRPVRALALKVRVVVIGTLLVLGVLFVTNPIRFAGVGVSVDFVPLLLAGLAASFGARPIARFVEPRPALRRLDDALAAHRD